VLDNDWVRSSPAPATKKPSGSPAPAEGIPARPLPIWDQRHPSCRCPRNRHAHVSGSFLPPAAATLGVPTTGAIPIMTAWIAITLIGLVLAVLIPRRPIEAAASPSSGTAAATWQPGTVMLAAAGTGRGDLVIRS
jgi:hypothetical protein